MPHPTLFSTSSLHTLAQFYVSSDPEDYQKKFKDSLMYICVDFHFHWTILEITVPPGPEATSTTTIRRERGIIMRIIPMNEGKERSNNKYLLKELCFMIYLYSIQRYRYPLVQ